MGSAVRAAIFMKAGAELKGSGGRLVPFICLARVLRLRQQVSGRMAVERKCTAIQSSRAH
jgi:hypothetical protein